MKAIIKSKLYKNSSRRYLVCEGELIFQEIEVNKNVGSKWFEMGGKYFVPLIISHEEKISGLQDSSYNIKHKRGGHFGGEDLKYNRLVLVESNQLSPEFLEKISKGIVKENEKILIELDLPNLCNGSCGICDNTCDITIIKITKEGYVNLFIDSIKDEDELSTILKEFCDKNNYTSKPTIITMTFIIKFIKENYTLTKK